MPGLGFIKQRSFYLIVLTQALGFNKQRLNVIVFDDIRVRPVLLTAPVQWT